MNFEKSVWDPQEVITWLGNVSHNKLSNTPYVTARKVTKKIGTIIATIFDVGNFVRLETRCLYKPILVQTSWDSHFSVP